MLKTILSISGKPGLYKLISQGKNMLIVESIRDVYKRQDLNELSDEDRNAFMADVARVTRAMQKAFQPEKINYGAYSEMCIRDRA